MYNVEAIGHLGKAIDLAESLPDGPADGERRLRLKIDYGQALIASRGHGALETTAAFARAEEPATGIEDASEAWWRLPRRSGAPRAPSAAAKSVKRRELHICVLRRHGLRVPHAASEDDKSRKNFQSFLKSFCNARDNYSMEVRSDPFESAKSHFFDTSSWGAFCDVTLTLKQARQPDSGGWLKIDDYRCRQAFRHFMNLLNRAVYGAAFRRYGKRLRVLPVLEKGEVRARALRSWDRGTTGRWHIHCAIELPSHFDGIVLENLIRDCWAKVEWGYGRILVRDGANAGWINYMLKDRQKSEFDGFADCIIIESLHNRVLQRQQERRKDTSRKAT
ncbi:MAG: hypothetical protein WB347_16985 [Terriglobales bacterium]